MNEHYPSKDGTLVSIVISAVVSPVRGGLTCCQNCVKSLSLGTGSFSGWYLGSDLFLSQQETPREIPIPWRDYLANPTAKGRAWPSLLPDHWRSCREKAEAVSYLDDEPQRRKAPLKRKDGKVTVKERVSQEKGGEEREDNRERETCQEENHEMCKMLLRGT